MALARLDRLPVMARKLIIAPNAVKPIVRILAVLRARNGHGEDPRRNSDARCELSARQFDPNQSDRNCAPINP